jgi:uncharacterized protein YndB with AHSA1/START domain
MTDTYELDIDIAAPRDRAWTALTDSGELERWFCEHADVSLDDKRYDFWGRFTPGVPDRDQGRHRILDVDPQRLLRFSFPVADKDTTVELTLNGDTNVHVLHTDVPTRISGPQAHVRHLWSGALAQLRGYVEMGRPGPRFDYTWPHMGGFTVHADIDAPRSDVWPALLDGWKASQFRRPARKADEDFAWDVGVTVGIKVLELVENERYTLEWRDPNPDLGATEEVPTVLTYSLEDSRGGTRVTIVHSGFASDVDVQGMAEGFFSGLYDLAWRLETNGAWPPSVMPAISDTGIPQSGGAYGVRVLQSGTN